MNSDKLNDLQIRPEDKRRSQRSPWLIYIVVFLIAGVAIFFAWPRASDSQRIHNGKKDANSATAAVADPASNSVSSNNVPTNTDTILTVSGYIINRQRIELSPRYMGTVTWIGVKKGDIVTNGQVVVLLDARWNTKARLHEAEGRTAEARASVDKAKLDYDRIVQLNKTQTESKKAEDDARIQLEVAQATLKEVEGTRRR